jgi:hypothetical protein
MGCSLYAWQVEESQERNRVGQKIEHTKLEISIRERSNRWKIRSTQKCYLCVRAGP